MWEAAKRGADGVIFDDAGEAFAPDAVLLARRLGRPAENFDVVARAVRECGFVHVVGVLDAVLVELEPAAVRPLAAFAAFYEIAGRAPRRLILCHPGDRETPDRYEVLTNPIDGLRRMESALAARGAEAPAPRRSLAASSRPTGIAVKTKARAGDLSERLTRPLEAIRPADCWLGELLGVWRSARSGDRLPSAESIDPLELLNIARGRAHIVDTRDADPEGYRFRLWGTVNSYGGGHANKTLGEMPAGLMRDDAIEDYRGIVSTGAPSYQLIRHVENNRPYAYARLVLPLAADGRRVDCLVVLINERRLVELAAP